MAKYQALPTTVIALAAFLASSAFADYRLPLQAPVGAANKAVRIEVGQQVRILLEARGNGGREVSFLLREGPKRGKLGAIEKTAAGQAVVTYTHNGRKGPGVDSFRYAVQASGGPVSAAGVVTVEAVDRGPHLEFPMVLDFGNVVLGDHADQDIELVNSGGGVVVGSIAGEGPFQVIDEPAFRLGPQGRARLQIRFAPKAQGESSGMAVVAAPGGGQIELHGSCVIPFSISPESTRLVSDSDGCRAARYEIHNTKEEELVCSLQYEGPIRGPDEVRLAPLDVGFFDVWADESNPGGGQGKIIARDHQFEVALSAVVDPLLARLKVGPSSVIELGDIPQGSTATTEVWVENQGGAPITVKFAAPGIQMKPAAAEASVGPGVRYAVQLGWVEPLGGKSLRRVQVSASGGTAQTVEIHANFLGEQSTLIPNLSSNSVSGGEQIVYADPLSSAAVVDKIELIRRTEKELGFKWEVPEGAVGFIIELQVFEKKGDHWEMAWRKVQPDALRIKNGIAEMELKGLYPGAGYAFRIRSKDDLDRVSPPSPEVQTSTAIRKPLHVPWIGITVAFLFVGACVSVYFRWIRRSQSIIRYGSRSGW